jgi:hydrogenase expression/formation protein HypE
MQTHDKILLGHGSGGKLMHDLIEKVFLKHFNDPVLLAQGDSAVMPVPEGRLAFTTDAYVVQPLFFAGGNIGKIAVCGTINDLVAAGARPLYLSVAFIIEEGLEFSVLEEIVQTMAETARHAGVRIVCGDTKVVGKGQCDKLFITTSGMGRFKKRTKILAQANGFSLVIISSSAEPSAIMAWLCWLPATSLDLHLICNPIAPRST